MDITDKIDLYLYEISIDMSKLNRQTKNKKSTLEDYLEQLNILNKKAKAEGKTMIGNIGKNNVVRS